MDVEQHGTRGVSVVGDVHAPLGHFPDKPGINGTEQQFAALRALAGAFDMVKDPLHFGAGEVRVHHQAGGFADVLFHAVALELLADIRGAAALPDDGVVNRLTGLTLPNDGGFTLVGDADGGNFVGVDIGFRQHFDQRRALRGPNLHRVVLNPAWLRINLFEFTL